VANRFIRLIEAGIIDTEAALKREFRARALETHPDQAQADDRGAAFMRLKAEYEVALRFLAPPVHERPLVEYLGEAGRGRARTGRPTRAPGRTRYDRDLFYADLSALLKAGFPKQPRHDQERRKYARLRLLVLSSLEAYDEAGLDEANEAICHELDDGVTEQDEALGQEVGNPRHLEFCPRVAVAHGRLAHDGVGEQEGEGSGRYEVPAAAVGYRGGDGDGSHGAEDEPVPEGSEHAGPRHGGVIDPEAKEEGRYDYEDAQEGDKVALSYQRPERGLGQEGADVTQLSRGEAEDAKEERVADAAPDRWKLEVIRIARAREGHGEGGEYQAGTAVPAYEPEGPGIEAELQG